MNILSSSALFLTLIPTAWASDVLVVDPAQATAFSTIQGAVNSASDGDVVLIRTGTYTESVSVAAVGLTLVADGAVVLDGTLAFVDLPLGSMGLVGGLEIHAPDDSSLPGIYLAGCDGPVRIVDCEVWGADDVVWTVPVTPTGAGIIALDSRDLALIDSEFHGGSGGIYGGGFGSSSPYTGAAGIHASHIDRLGMIRSVLSGGRGPADIFGRGGDGGDGSSVLNSTRILIAYSAFVGGTGGDGDANAFSISGDGGTGLVADAGSRVWNFQGVFIPGTEGCQGGGFCNPGSPGSAVDGGAVLTPLDGFPTRLSTPLLVLEGSAFTSEVVSIPGEAVRLIVGPRTSTRFRPSALQPLLVRRPAAITRDPIGTIPGSSRLTLHHTAGPLPMGSQAQVHWMQVTVAGPSGSQHLSSPRPVIVVGPQF